MFLSRHCFTVEFRLEADCCLIVVDEEGIGYAILLDESANAFALFADINNNDLLIIIDHIRNKRIAVGFFENHKGFAVFVFGGDNSKRIIAADEHSGIVIEVIVDCGSVIPFAAVACDHGISNMGIASNGIVRIDFKILDSAGEIIESAYKTGFYYAFITVKSIGNDIVCVAVCDRSIVCAKACPMVVGAVEHVFVFVFGHNTKAIRGFDSLIEHSVGCGNMRFGAFIGVGISCREVEHAALRNKKRGYVELGIFFSKFVYGICPGCVAFCGRKEIFKTVVAADKNCAGIVCIDIVGIVAGFGFRNDVVGIIGKSAVSAGFYVFLVFRNDLDPAYIACVGCIELMAQCRCKFFAAGDADLGFGAGCFVCRGVADAGRKFFSADFAGLGFGTGCFVTGTVALCFNKHLFAFGAVLIFNAGCRRTRNMGVSASGKSKNCD